MPLYLTTAGNTAKQKSTADFPFLKNQFHFPFSLTQPELFVKRPAHGGGGKAHSAAATAFRRLEQPFENGMRDSPLAESGAGIHVADISCPTVQVGKTGCHLIKTDTACAGNLTVFFGDQKKYAVFREST